MGEDAHGILLPALPLPEKNMSWHFPRGTSGFLPFELHVSDCGVRRAGDVGALCIAVGKHFSFEGRASAKCLSTASLARLPLNGNISGLIS